MGSVGMGIAWRSLPRPDVSEYSSTESRAVRRLDPLADARLAGRFSATESYSATPRAIRSLLNIQGDRPTEAAVATLIEDGELQPHVARVRRVYANRREILANSLRRTFGDQVEFTLAPAEGRLGPVVGFRRRRSMGTPQYPARCVVVPGPPLFLRRPSPSICAIQLCLAERARATRSGEANGCRTIATRSWIRSNIHAVTSPRAQPATITVDDTHRVSALTVIPPSAHACFVFAHGREQA